MTVFGETVTSYAFEFHFSSKIKQTLSLDETTHTKNNQQIFFIAFIATFFIKL